MRLHRHSSISNSAGKPHLLGNALRTTCSAWRLQKVDRLRRRRCRTIPKGALCLCAGIILCGRRIPANISETGELKMKKVFLSAVVGLSTLAFVEGAETQTQPATGTPAPDFSLTTSDGSQVSLKDYRGKWVVLYFYPKDFTSGCTMEAKNFQRDLAKYEQAGAIVLGVSVDTAQSHKDFCAKEGLNFRLLADPDAKVSTEYGSVMDYKGATVAARNTFIVNPKGEIAKVYTGVKPADHSEQVLKDLAELKKS